MILYFKLLFFASFLFTSVHGSVLTQGCNWGDEDKQIKAAVSQAREVAIAAFGYLASGKVNGKEDVFRAAFDPLFTNADRIRLGQIFGSVVWWHDVSDHLVTIYCSENHIVPNKQKGYWLDNAYTSKPNGKNMPLSLPGPLTAKPGAKGSYTTLGFKHDDQWDSAHLGHIYIAESRRRPRTDNKFDLRSYDDIIKDGLDNDHHKLESIKPLAQTMLHEFIHIAGGLKAPNSPKLQVTDGPTKDTYGWEKCNKRRLNGDSNIDIADCITYLGQALYLQIQKKDTYWSTGEVIKDTLRPANLPTTSSKFKRDLLGFWKRYVESPWSA